MQSSLKSCSYLSCTEESLKKKEWTLYPHRIFAAFDVGDIHHTSSVLFQRDKECRRKEPLYGYGYEVNREKSGVVNPTWYMYFEHIWCRSLIQDHIISLSAKIHYGRGKKSVWKKISSTMVKCKTKRSQNYSNCCPRIFCVRGWVF